MRLDFNLCKCDIFYLNTIFNKNILLVYINGINGI